MQRFMDSVRIGEEEEYRKLNQNFSLNTTKTRGMVVDFRCPRPQPNPATITGVCEDAK